jgi:hypothetical protein
VTEKSFVPPLFGRPRLRKRVAAVLDDPRHLPRTVSVLLIVVGLP